ncbi:hypothetical protein [Desulfosarcina variabilis]|uniref:hypothetical protein n=1 Tax=Desulfosarcina variabilis TaxID=2300 RepID=UPI003AFAE9A4
MKIKLITSIEELKRSSIDGCECFILLKGGLRSSRHIWYNERENQFEIINYIDGSEEMLSEQEMMESSNIGYAMMNRAFFIEM